MHLTSILAGGAYVVLFDGSRATFAFDDGGLFRGHTIRVDFMLEEMSVDDVSIELESGARHDSNM